MGDHSSSTRALSQVTLDPLLDNSGGVGCTEERSNRGEEETRTNTGTMISFFFFFFFLFFVFSLFDRLCSTAQHITAQRSRSCSSMCFFVLLVDTAETAVEREIQHVLPSPWWTKKKTSVSYHALVASRQSQKAAIDFGFRKVRSERAMKVATRDASVVWSLVDKTDRHITAARAATGKESCQRRESGSREQGS